MVPETCRRKFATRSASRSRKPRPRCYTVCKPVWETKTRCYTVCKPVWETKTKEICYTVCKPVWETKTRTSATPCASRSGKPRPAATRSASRSGKPRPAATPSASRSGKPSQKEICYTVCKPVWETKTALLHRLQAGLGNRVSVRSRYQVAVKVPYTKTIQVQSGHWENQTYEVARPACHKTVASVGTFEWDPCQCKCVYKPGPCVTLDCQGPPIKCCKRVWVPECIDEGNPVLQHRVPDLHADGAATRSARWSRRLRPAATRSATWCPSSAPARVLQGLPHGARAAHLLLQGLPHGARAAHLQATRSATWCPSSAPAATRSATWCPSNARRPCCYKVCHMVPEQRTCSYKVCHMVPEQRTCTYKVCHMVPEQRTKTVCYTVCKPVCEQQTVKCYKCVPRTECYTKTVAARSGSASRFPCRFAARSTLATRAAVVPRPRAAAAATEVTGDPASTRGAQECLPQLK